MKLLLAEDEKELARALAAVITLQGYDVIQVFDGEQASAELSEHAFDVAVLDIMMPKKDGMQVLRDMRAAGDNTPVLMLTAKAEVENRVEGLDAGANDYLTKPFAMKELLARIRVLTRNTEKTHEALVFGNVKLDIEKQELSCTNSIRLASKEAELMTYFMRNPGKELSTQTIFEHIWKDDKDVTDEVVWMYVSFLRKKLESVSADVVITGEKNGSFILVQE